MRDARNPVSLRVVEPLGILVERDLMIDLISSRKYVLGAPGFQDWSGKSVTYETAQGLQYPFSTTPVEMRDSADYAGYAVDQIIIGDTEYVVHGAPRKDNVIG